MGIPSSRILDDLQVGVWVGRVPGGEVSYENQAFREIHGLVAPAEDDAQGRASAYRVLDRAGNPYPIERRPFQRVIANGRGVVVDDMVIQRSDGSRVSIRANGQPLRDPAGNLTHVVVAVTDITREVEAEAERERFEARLELVIDHAPIALWAIDREGIITLSEGAGLKALGLRPGEVVGQSVFELYQDHPTIPGYIRRGLEGAPLHYSVTVGEVVFETWLTPLRDAAGRLQGLLGVSLDMTELRRLQAATIQNDRVMAMGMLAASVAHEINNPLTYVLGYLDSLQRAFERQAAALDSLGDAPGTEAVRAASAGIDRVLHPLGKGIERIATIARDLRSLSRPDDERFEPIDVPKVIEGVLELVRKDVEARARLRLDLQPALVLGNEARLLQVVLNLVVNARQSLAGGRPDRDEVAISARTEGERVLIEVADSGPGVPLADRERIFEPFVTSKPVGEGTGLGLFVCRTIVQGLGGGISVHDRPGGGAMFRVELPAARAFQDGRASPAQRETTADPSVRGRVLVVDDDEMVARVLAAQLEAAHIGVEVESDSSQALDLLLSGQPYDLVYCDLMMKGLSGMDLAQQLETRAPDRLARLVFMTGGAFTPRASAFLSAHRDNFVEKPFDVVAETRRRLGAAR